MNNFVLEIWNNEASKCTFYTVRKEDSKTSETDKFFKKYYAIAEFKKPVQELLSFVLDSIGEDHGAIEMLCNRFENEVIGLPNRGKANLGEITLSFPNFPLRLYALRVNNRSDLLILFNGGVKSALTNQASKDLNLKWREACQFAKRIEAALRSEEIIVDNRERSIRAYDVDEEIIL
ncbi:hypothetical protein [Chitinophaga sp. S165]|uniref:hypothetical protein n=1 Tax=Chitinophaga sp. S165 TaxID=2135462 RepID=UPI000D714654|nr:hypothetical protein [Chitinophaga sp. S165]PWV54442.1 hypothetical protein C7475_1021201 [Chitinophaga sp. S165]